MLSIPQLSFAVGIISSNQASHRLSAVIMLSPGHWIVGGSSSFTVTRKVPMMENALSLAT